MTQREIITKNLIAGIKELDFNSVFEWIARPLSNKDFPVAVIEDRSDKVEDKNDCLEHNLTFAVTLFITDTENAIKKARDEAQKVLTKIKELDNSLKLGEYVTLTKVDLDVEQNNELVAIAEIEIICKYHTPRLEI